MPTRSERDGFADALQGNPFEGMSVERVYCAVRWGNAPKRSWEISAPEALVGLGQLAMLDVVGHEETYHWDEGRGPFVAVGADSNLVYVLPRMQDGGPVDRVPGFCLSKWARLGRARQTDYYSDKGGEVAYYYHEHEPPFPTLYEAKNGVVLYVPARLARGRRSYGVVPEGIVG